MVAPHHKRASLDLYCQRELCLRLCLFSAVPLFLTATPQKQKVLPAEGEPIPFHRQDSFVYRHKKCTSAIELPAALLIQRPRQSSCQWHLRSSGPGNRVASDTFDPAASACDMPAHFRSSGPVMRHASSLSTQRTGNRVASVTFDPAVPAIELPATLSTQRPRQSSCQQHFRPSGPGNQVASGTFDPAAPAIELPAALSIQRTGNQSCRRIKNGDPLRRTHVYLLLTTTNYFFNGE